MLRFVLAAWNLRCRNMQKPSATRRRFSAGPLSVEVLEDRRVLSLLGLGSATGLLAAPTGSATPLVAELPAVGAVIAQPSVSVSPVASGLEVPPAQAVAVPNELTAVV